MRDILTILAGLVIAVMTAALAVPPLIDWPAQRGLVDRAIARAVGMEAKSDGALEVRLLPFPRIKMDRLRLGSFAPDEASLDAMFVRAEIALTPLLSGEVRLLDTRIGRAEFKLPTGAGGEWRVPRRLVANATGGRAFVFEALTLQQLIVTTTEPLTGRTDQAFAQGVRVQAGSLRGPWRFDGTAGAVPFELAFGEIGADLSTTVKLGGGGGDRPRFDVDGRIELADGPGDSLVPRFAGTAKIAVPPAARPSETSPLPVAAQASLKAVGGDLTFEGLSFEAGEGAAAIRLVGTARYRIDDPKLTLALEGRRVDLPALLAASPSGVGGRLAAWRNLAELPVDFAVKLDGLAIGSDEDLTGVRATGSLRDAKLTVDSLEVAAPGGAAVRLAGTIDLGREPTVAGRVQLNVRESDRFVRFLGELGVGGLGTLVDGRPLEVAADVNVADPVVSVRNLRVAQGAAILSGAMRYTAPDRGARARVDAQLAVTGLDLTRSPDPGPLFEAARALDFGIVLDARALTYRSSRNGRVAARLATEGGSVVVDTLEVTDLAGAEARLSGRLAPDGSGRIEGRLKAARAAPLVDLFGGAWLGGAARLVPAAFREGALDVAVLAERVAEAGRPAAALRTSLRGVAAGGPIEASAVSVDGKVRSLAATVSTERSATWFGADAIPPLRRSRLDLSATRDGSGRLAASLEGEVAGIRIATLRPVTLGPGDDRVDAGEIELTASDASPVLALIGDASLARDPVGLALKVAVARSETFKVKLAGRIAGADVVADLSGASPATLTGEASFSRLSLPLAASVFALQLPSGLPAGSLWSTARFGAQTTFPVGGTIRVRSALLDLGAGLTGRDGSFLLASTPEGVGFKDLSFGLAGGRVSGEASLSRQGGLASISGEGSFERLEVATFLAPPFTGGRFGGKIRFGASGESLAALVANLGGAGNVELDGLRVEAADPGAPDRVAARALRGDDPLAAPRLAALLGEELGRAPLVARRVAASATLIGGSLRLTPLRLEADTGAWQGAATIDLRTLSLDARGALQPNTLPRHWSAAPPYVTVGWTGPLARPTRTIDPGPLVNGLAAVVLQRELERIEVFELDAAERSRINGRVELDKQRRAAAEEAVRQARLREETAERARLEAERARLEAERTRAEADRARSAGDSFTPPTPPDRRPAPLDIRPPPQSGSGVGGPAGG